MTADVFAECNQANDGIREQASAQSLTFVVHVNAEMGQQSHGLGVPAGSLEETRGSGLEADLCHAPRVVGHDVPAAQRCDHEDPS